MIFLQAFQELNEVDGERFAAIYQTYSHQIFYFVRQILRNDQQAEDAVSDTFLHVLEAWHRISRWDETRIRAFLYVTAKNIALDTKRRKREFLVDGKEGEALQPPEERTFWDYVELKTCIEKLDPIYQDVLMMKYYLNLTSREIAKHLSLPLSTTNSRLRRAKEQLYQMLKEPNPDDDSEDNL